MARKDNSKLREMIKEYGIKDMNDVHEFVKMLTAETIQAALDAELENDLGYSKYDYKNKNTENSRNGYSPKTVQGNMGELEIQVPRDRNGDFEPQLVKKHQTDVSSIEDKVIFLYLRAYLPVTYRKPCRRCTILTWTTAGFQKLRIKFCRLSRNGRNDRFRAFTQWSFWMPYTTMSVTMGL